MWKRKQTPRKKITDLEHVEYDVPDAGRQDKDEGVASGMLSELTKGRRPDDVQWC